ncbi:MAG: hypothetical protein JWQ11_1419 [Rhizobacter sp.]|nr:hypothetical protein [Rhizobacter sp.]
MDEADWIDGFVRGLANPTVAGDEAYLRLIGERLYPALWQLAPAVVVETLRQQWAEDDARRGASASASLSASPHRRAPAAGNVATATPAITGPR